MRAPILLFVTVLVGCGGQGTPGKNDPLVGADKGTPPAAGDKDGTPDPTRLGAAPNIRPIGKRNEKPAVEALVNNQHKEWWASKCKLGEKVRLRGQILSSPGTWIRVNNCHPYDGPETSVAADVLTRDFAGDWDKAIAKYKRHLSAPRFDRDIVVEGYVAGWDPVHNALILAGHVP